MGEAGQDIAILESTQPGLAVEGAGKESLWTRDFVFLCLANLCVFITVHILLSTMPVYIVGMGGDKKDVGIVMGIFTIAATLMRPFGGRLLDSYDRKKTLLAGLALTAAVALIYHAAAAIMLLIFVRLVHGISFSISTTATGTLASDLLPRDRLGEGMGYFGLTTSLSMAVAPLIGLWLVGIAGFTALFNASIVAAVIAIVVSIIPGYDKSKLSHGAIDKIEPGWSGYFEKNALKASFIMFFLATVWGGVISFVALYAQEKGIANVGLFFTANALTMIFSRPFAGRWSDKNGAYKVILAGIVFIGISTVTIAFSKNLTGFLFAGAAYGLGFGFCLPSLQALAVRDVSPYRRGAATGTFFSSLDLGIGLGTILFGWVALYTSYHCMYLAAVLPVLIGGIVCVIAFSNKRVS
ncbi:major facilitator superfamily transporter [Pelotomaculum sp. FP]|uniref:MFS transporter n=1 Tax=Pelotomaculum sp. FP TaxID=261474 RepID=UPI0010669868|nr:MFS transporter [Pelotomaculum sp. FP]TEB16387.1 major facilitator superfamily transporter [Pelotomaculum sp. FP]